MKFFKKILLAILIIPCAFMFTACLNAEPNVYLVDVVFDQSGDEIVCTYIYSNGYKKTKTIKNQGDSPKTILDISKKDNESNIYIISYSDGSTSQITIDSDNTNSITKFEKKPDSEYIYIISYENGTKDEITIIGQNTPIEENNEAKIISIYNKIINSAVTINASQTAGGTSIGSGVIYSMNKSIGGKTYILTNHHVVEDPALAGQISNISNTITGISSTITVYPYGSTSSLTARCIGISESNDVAVLMVDTMELLELNKYSYAPNIAGDRVLGDTAIAVGNPMNQGLSITSGHVSLENKFIYTEGSTYERRVFGLDTPINSGNSGGGIFNIDGELIGLADAKMIESIDDESNSTENLDNLGYALPIELVDAIANNIIDQYETTFTASYAKKIKLGVTITNSNSRAEQDLEGITRIETDVTVAEITNGMLAQTKFNLAVDDVLREIIINDISYSISQIYDLDVYLLNIRAGDSVKFKYTRGGTIYTSTAYTIKASDITTIVE